MKLASLFNLIVDAQDILDFFEGVTNPDQLRSRLARVQRLEAEDFLTCLDGLRSSISSALNDTIEMSPEIESSPDEISNDEVENLVSDVDGEENQNPESPPEPGK